MKKIFEFDCPDDDEDYKIFAQALKMHSLLLEFSHELRQCEKYGKPTTRDRFWKKRFWELAEEYGVEIVWS